MQYICDTHSICVNYTITKTAARSKKFSQRVYTVNMRCYPQLIVILPEVALLYTKEGHRLSRASLIERRDMVFAERQVTLIYRYDPLRYEIELG